MRNNEKNSIELHAFCTQFYPPTLSNFTCMHEYPPLPKKKKKISPNRSIIRLPSSSIQNTPERNIHHRLLSSEQLNFQFVTSPPLKSILRTALIRHFHSSLEREEVYTQFQASRPRISFDRGNRLSKPNHHLDPTFSTLDFSNRNRTRKVRKEENLDVDFPIYISDRSTSG